MINVSVDSEGFSTHSELAHIRLNRPERHHLPRKNDEIGAQK